MGQVGQNIFALFRPLKGPGPSKTQNWACRPPPVDPHFGPICGQKGRFWGQKPAFFSKKNSAPNHFILGPRWSGTLKNPKLALYAPRMDPVLADFVGKKADFGVQKRVFLKFFFAPNHFFIGSQTVWDAQKPISTPRPPNGPILACSGTSGRHATRLVSYIRAQHYLNPSHGI